MTGSPKRPRQTAASLAAAALAAGLGLLLTPLHPTDAAARRPDPGVQLPPMTADEDLPIPPIPPEVPPLFSAAPVPDDEPAPTIAAAPPSGAQIGPGVFGQRYFGEGNGYLSGSTSHAEQDRRPPPAGIQLNMPLQ